MKIGNAWALTTTEVCSALNKVRAMKLCMVLVWIVISYDCQKDLVVIQFVFVFCDALFGERERKKGTICAYIKTKFIQNTKTNIKSF